MVYLVVAFFSLVWFKQTNETNYTTAFSGWRTFSMACYSQPIPYYKLQILSQSILSVLLNRQTIEPLGVK